MTTPHLFDAIGWAVVHSLWQGLVIGLAVYLILQWNRRRSAAIRHAASFLGLLVMLVAFVTTAALMLANSPGVESAGFSSIETAGGLEAGVSTAARSTPERAATSSPTAMFAVDQDLSWIPGVITWLWLGGVGLMSTRMAGQWWWSRRLRGRGTEPIDAVWKSTFESLRSRCGVGDRVRLLISRTIDSPMAVGWLHPVILVPASAFTSLDPEQLRTILVHELHHLARRDHLLNMAQAMIEVVLFFHPVTWWLSRQVRIERELCCDDATLEITESPSSLAEALLALESLRTLNTTRPGIQLAATGGSLMHRITRLTGSDSETTSRAGWRIVSASAILAVAGAAVAATNIESPDAFQPQAQRADDPVDRRTRIDERLRAMGTKLREQVAAGEMTAEEAREKFAEAEERMSRRVRMAEERAGDDDKRMKRRDRKAEEGSMRMDAQEARDVDLEQLKASIEARIKAMGERLAAMVEAGEISEADAKARYEEGERRMWTRYRAAEEGAVRKGADEVRDIDLEELKTSIEARLKAMGMELRKQVAAGEMTAEDAKAKYDAAEVQMWRRFRMAEEKAAGGEQRNMQDLEQLKTSIEDRLKAMGVELRKQVAAGEMTAEDAKAKYDAAEEQMWRRFRMAEEKAGEGERRENAELEELATAIQERLQALGMELREQVAAGEMTAEEAREKYADAEERMWRRFRMAEEKAADGERGENAELEELATAIQERLQALGMGLREQVAAGEMTAEEAKEKYAEAEERMWRRFRMAEEKAGEGERGENRELDELEAAIEERLQAMGMELRRQVAAGEMTGEEAREKFADAEERMWRRFRMAEEEAGEGDERMKRRDRKAEEKATDGEERMDRRDRKAEEKATDGDERMKRRDRKARKKAAGADD